MKKLVLLGVWIILFSPQLFSQVEPTKKNYEEVIPVSPNTASLGSFGVIPVGHYSGTANVSIPIYEIDLDGKKIPISLSYNSRGIKVAQESSSVGLGWALDAGGCISRNIRGIDDFQNKTGKFGYYWEERVSNSYDVWYDRYIARTQHDPEPDLFYYNFCGNSGSMFVTKSCEDNSQSVVSFKMADPKMYINPKYYPGSKTWQITDEDGYVYFFNTSESTKNFGVSHTSYPNRMLPHREVYVNGYEEWLTTSWYLDSIKSPKNNTVKFHYRTEDIQTPVNMTEEVYYANDAILQEGRVNSFPYKKGFYNYGYSQIYQKVLSKIEFNNNTILFEGSDRLDLIAGGTLPQSKPKNINRIVVKNNISIVKQIDLGQSYVGNISDPIKCRLVLNSVKDGDQLYKMEYYLGSLPEKNSFQTDYWGYYNNGRLIDEMKPYFLTTPSAAFEGAFLSGRNKKASIYSTMAQALIAIQYPTGGKTNFEYQLNQFTNAVNMVDYEETSLAHVNYAVRENAYGTHYSSNVNIKDSSALNFQWNSQFTIINSNNTSGGGYITPSSSDYFMIYIDELKKNGSWALIGSIRRPFDRFQPDNPGYQYVIFRDHGQENKKVVVGPGTYRFSVFIMSNSVNKDFSITARMLAFAPVRKNINEGAGLRVSKTINEIDGKKEEKNYAYIGGKLMVPPLHYKSLVLQSQIWGVMPTGVFYNEALFAYINGRTEPYVPFSHNVVGYTTVEEKMGGNINGKTEYQFHNNEDKVISVHPFLPGMPTQADYLNGSPSKITHFDQVNKIKQIKSFEYKLLNQSTVQGLKIYYSDMFVSYGTMSSSRNGIWELYTLSNPKYVLNSEKTEDFLETPVVTTKKYTYDNNYFRIKTTEIQNSKNQTTKIAFNYPFDFSDNISQQMKTKSMINYPIDVINYIGTTEISRTKNNYSLIGGSNSILPLSTQTSTTGAAGLRANITYDLYDNKGNILQYTEQDGVPVSFIWGYNKQYPVAKIIGATYNDVKTKLTALELTNIENGIFNDSQLNLALNKIRTAYMKNFVQVSTYLYKPLIGITSETDPSGITTHYEYDTFGRLIRILDNKRNILKQYQYNYRR